ncbi:BnaC02g41830D [Brassica napus]|uniref:BnaC02g41830D protein n=1 Tax=Brassica napus TaxID=3708 RepID=A0A078HTZ1_BRANA|nr:BnaC02g41830D [Brassica napus]
MTIPLVGFRSVLSPSFLHPSQ